MSTRDSLATINGSYKKQVGKKIGFTMRLLASYKDGIITYNDSIFPACGPLLFIVNNNKRRTLDLDITFDYRQAVPNGYVNNNVRGISIKDQDFLEDSTWKSGNITLEVSHQVYYEKLYKNSYDNNITRETNYYGDFLFKKDNNPFPSCIP